MVKKGQNCVHVSRYLMTPSKNDVNFRPRLFLIAWFQFDFFNAKDASKGLIADIFDRNISRIFFNKGQN